MLPQSVSDWVLIRSHVPPPALVRCVPFCTVLPGGPLVSDLAGTCNCARSCALSSVPGGNGAADDVEAVHCISCCAPRNLWLFFSSVVFLVGGMM